MFEGECFKINIATDGLEVKRSDYWNWPIVK